jgi:hypothetical protein
MFLSNFSLASAELPAPCTFTSRSTRDGVASGTMHIYISQHGLAVFHKIASPDDDDPMLLCVCVLLKRTKAESEAQRGKPKGALESESRNAIV